MLHRCVATDRCCPKLHEEEMEGRITAGPGSMHYNYPNSYMFEEYANPSAALSAEGEEFPAGALSLMYSPPCGDDFAPDVTSTEESVTSDYGHLMDVARLRGSAVAPSLRVGAAFAGTGMGSIGGVGARPPPDWAVHDAQASAPRRFGAPMPETPRRSDGDNCDDIQPEVWSRELEPGGDGYIPPPGEFANGIEGKRWLPGVGYGTPPPGYTANGAETIAALERVQLKAKQLPLHQQPNSAKWVERWNGAQFSRDRP
eukprot:TRINITY_DN30841_c0_g1_i1.p1 TRINITY_DN30841_c0_g1~~TRINITY_DN30841_c0_g1_i1.p1  ORF type:complete len:257 (-),score=59.45 TRINITY_DN30841_c0_g1_i1:168-938(-)